MSMNIDNYYRDADQCECEVEDGSDHRDQEIVTDSLPLIVTAAEQERWRLAEREWLKDADWEDPFADD
jgi:hypothetical protein